MFCPKCGRQLSDTAKFCPKCGSSVTNRPAPAPSPQTFVSPAPAPAPAQQTKAGSSGAKIGILVGVLTALVVLVGAFAFMYFQDMLPFLPRDGGSDLQESEDRRDRDDDKDADPDDGGNDRDKGDGGSGSDNSDGNEDGGNEDEPPVDPYPDSVDPAQLASAPAGFVGSNLSVNATVNAVFNGDIRADIDSGTGVVFPVYLSFDSAATLSPGDKVYIEGSLNVQGDGFYYLPAATVTFTEGANAGSSLTSAAGVPLGVPETVTNYDRYAGTYAAVGDSTTFMAQGGPLVVLSTNPAASEILYTVTTYDPHTGSAAQMDGAFLMDGSSIISFSGDDGWGNDATGTVYLLSSGAVAVEAYYPNGTSSAWGIGTAYTDLVRCSGTIPQLYEPRSDHTQEVIVSSRGTSATLTLRNWDHGKWTDQFSTTASLGANGINYDKKEGDKSTPAGTFDILFAFGTADRSLNIDYYKIKAGDVWVDDSNSRFYNTMQTTSTPGKDWTSAEDLYNKFVGNRSVGCIYFNYNGDGLTGGSAEYKGGSDLFIDGLGTASSMGPGYGDIRVTAADFETLVSLLDSSRNPKLIIS